MHGEYSCAHSMEPGDYVIAVTKEFFKDIFSSNSGPNIGGDQYDQERKDEGKTE